MKRYDEFDSFADTIFTKYKIIVQTEEDKQELEQAFEHLHNTDCDPNYIIVNQLIHEYLTQERTGNKLTKNNIVVDKELYERLR
jgi:hypothetical protein